MGMELHIIAMVLSVAVPCLFVGYHLGRYSKCEYCGNDTEDDLYTCDQCQTVSCPSCWVEGNCPHCGKEVK